jgi:hypothetical protein
MAEDELFMAFYAFFIEAPDIGRRIQKILIFYGIHVNLAKRLRFFASLRMTKKGSSRMVDWLNSRSVDSLNS